MATACITGASSGIGKEFAKILSKKGYDLILIARNEKVLKNMSRKLPSKCTVITCDLSDEEKTKKLCDFLEGADIDVFINNAGFGDLGAFDETNADNDCNMINVNIKAMHLLTKAILPGFKKRNSGYIMNVASVAGLMAGGPYMSTYYATKSYVVSLTSAIYEELKISGSNVHISALCPGPVDTNFNKTAGVSFSLNGITPSFCAAYGLCQMFKGKLIIIPTMTIKAAAFASRIIPRKLLLNITAKQQTKKGI